MDTLVTDKNDGRIFSVPPSRRLTWDLLYFNRAVPQCGHDRHMDLSALADARKRTSVRISWPALFLKAYGLVAKSRASLRQTWSRWPIAHIYQHPCSVGILTVQREYKGEPWLFWARIPEPENKTLPEIQALIERFQFDDVETVFRKELQLAHMPTIARRMIWGWNVHVSKSKRAKRLGTFFLSTLAGKGAEIQVPPSIHTGCLTYGPLSEVGSSRITLAYDHRLMDGAYVADCLASLELIFMETLQRELLQLCTTDTNIIRAA